MEASCPVCYEESVDLLCHCPYCNQAACVQCSQDYIHRNVLDTGSQPHCMYKGCEKTWTSSFILSHFDPDWIKNVYYPEIIARFLVQEAMSHAPHDQETALLYLKYKEIRKEISELPTVKKLERQFKKKSPEFDNALQEVRLQRETLTAQSDQIYTELDELLDKNEITLLIQRNIDIEGEPRRDIPKKQRVLKQVIMRCIKDDCKGFIYNDFQCGLCKTRVCHRCHEVADNRQHKCNPDILASCQLLKKDTRPCANPECAIPTYRISGCDMMWCTECKTPWNWVTGQIETGVNHNPHYFQYLHRMREAGQAVPVPEPECNPNNIQQIRTLILRMNRDIQRNRTLEIFRILTHWTAMFQELTPDRIRENLDLRIKYLINEITLEKMSHTMLHREKRRMNIAAYREIVQAAITVTTDILHRVVYNQTTPEKGVDEFKEWLQYMENTVDELQCIYPGKAPAHIIPQSHIA